MLTKIAMARNIEERSYWLRNADTNDKQPPLPHPIKTDIVVVGGGFTGLWTVYFLKKFAPDVRVVLFESGRIGHGASGRNAGMLCPGFDHSYALSIEHFGHEEARRLEQFGQQNVSDVAAFAVDCDLELTGTLNVALIPEHVEIHRNIAEAAQSLGIDGCRFLGADEVQRELHSPLFQAAFYNPHGGILDPYKMSTKLLREVTDMGVEVYENTPVEHVEAQRLHVPGGIVEADRTVLATDAFTHLLEPSVARWYVPVYDYVIVSDPLSDEDMASIGWGHRQAVWDSRTFFNYYRLTSDNRILWGSGEAKYYPNNGVGTTYDFSEDYRRLLLESFRKTFPQLPHLRFPFCWGGAIASSTRLTPFFGDLHGGSVLYGLGYTGQGVANTRIGGKVLALKALDKHDELLEFSFVKKKPRKYPPTILRKVAIDAIGRALRQTDAGEKPGMLLKILDAVGIEFSS